MEDNITTNNALINNLNSELPQIDLKIEVYSISYDWGIASMGAPNFKEFSEPYYKGTLDRQFTSANFSIDSTSDMRYTCSFSIILDYNSDFIVHANDRLFWQNVWFKVIKTYDYPNGNKETNNAKDEHIIGWFVPNSGSYSYNASSREFSMSCTDMMSFLTDSRGGHSSNFRESLGGLSYIFYNTYKSGTNFEPQKGHTDEYINEDLSKAARYASGLVLEGEKNLTLQEKQYDNFLSKYNTNNIDNITNTNTLWNEIYQQYKYRNGVAGDGGTGVSEEPYRIKFYWFDENEGWNDTFFDDTNSMLASLIGGYAHIIPIHSVLVNLQNGNKLLPYDIEFNADTTLYDVLKKATDLHPRQSIYFDSDRRLNITQHALRWGGSYGEIAARKQDFLGLTLEEHWDVNLENIKNFTFVWGRNQTCGGYYSITSVKGICPKCGKLHETYKTFMGANGELYTCLLCGTPLRRLFMNDEVYSTQRIGTHKQVIYNDNLLTDKECFDAAKALTLESCRAKKTLSVTLFDRYLPLYNLSNGAVWGSDTGVGRLIEYTSTLTGETDLYTLLKWSNDFNTATVTLELEPFYPCIDERSYNILPIPEFDFEVDDTGFLIMYIKGQGELFKIYCSNSSLLSATENNIWHLATLDLNFIGETDNSIFTYQFTKSGTYEISCQAWSSTTLPSGVAPYKVLTVEIKEDTRIDINTRETSTEINGNNINIGINYLVTNDGDYLIDSDGNKFIY